MAEFPKKAFTIADIARAAGVSKATVSRYISGKRNLVSAETQARIQAVIDVTDFIPNSIAQSLRANRSHQVGVIVADITSPFSSALLRGISSVLLPAGYVPLFMESQDSPELERRFIRTLMARKIDGLIVNTSSDDNPTLIQLACQGFPVVLCDRRVNDYNFSFVGTEHRQPFLDAMDHLKDEGFTRVAFFTQSCAGNSARQQRLAAYTEKMRELYPGQNVQALTKIVDLENLAATQAALQELVDCCGPADHLAVIASNSITGMHLLSAARAQGLFVCRDFGMFCPDDFGWEGSVSWPMLAGVGISTCAVHPNKIGTESAKALLSLLSGEAKERVDIRLPSELTIRESTRLHTRVPRDLPAGSAER